MSENSHEVMTALMVSCYIQIAVVKIDCACNNFIECERFVVIALDYIVLLGGELG
jgi:hypothetical protein